MNDLEKFQNKIKVKFHDQQLLQQVFVHRSYLNENPSFKLGHNERLEFLGDAVLELVSTEFLYKNYTNPEGELTNWRSALVRGQMIAKIAHVLGMNDLLLLSKGEARSTGKARDLILANAFEALIGAIYLDSGYRAVQNFIGKNLLVHIDEVLDKKLYLDAKSHLQELIQEEKRITPHYEVLSETGPDHDKNFTVGVYIEDKLIGQGNGHSKQLAEQSAAENALSKIDK